MKHPVFDIETNGFLRSEGDDKPQATKIWCICMEDLFTGETYVADPWQGSIEFALQMLADAERIYGHNSIRYDVPVIKLLRPSWIAPANHTDSMVASRVTWAHLKKLDWALVQAGVLHARMVGKHSLKAWGHRLGLNKLEYETDFQTWDPEGTEYCSQDVTITRTLLKRIMAKAGGYQQALRMEMQLAEHIHDQIEGGVCFNEDKAIALQGTLAEERHKVGVRLTDSFGSWFTPGKQFTPKQDNARYHYVKGAECTKIKLITFSPTSRDHIRDRLTKLYGWVPNPKELTDGGKGKITEATLKGMDFPEADDLREYLMLDKRLNQLVEGPKAWMNFLIDGKIHGGVNTNGTGTHRASHAYPNLGQVPSSDTIWGPECRELFEPDPGDDMVGSDAMGLELRCLAHYMSKWDDGAFVDVILKGDPHVMFAKAWDLPRPKGKTKTYAYLYGAGNENLGDGDPALGKKRRKRLERMIPALGFLQKWVKAEHKKGFLPGLDGRKVYTRSEHSALNFLLQHAGSLIVKYWMVKSREWLEKDFGPPAEGLWRPLLWVHDEVQLSVRPDATPTVVQLLPAAMHTVNDLFNLKCPMDADVKVGTSWRETH